MEMYKISNMPATILNDIFAPRSTRYNLRNPVSFKMWKVHLIYNGNGTLSHLGPNIWNLVRH